MKKGKLKLFIGVTSPETTIALLIESKKYFENIYVYLGYIDPVEFNKIKTLLNNIDINIENEELEVDLILKRQPDTVFINNIAHTNPQGNRHPKRYQDIQEILENGINVVTTIDIRNIESQVQAIENIIEEKIFESVPDSFLESAESIQFVDISANEVLKTFCDNDLHHHQPEKEIMPYNLLTITALREIALKYTTSLVNKQLQDLKKIKLVGKSWKTSSAFLVAISPSPYSQYLIRWTRRTAFEQGLPWLAVYIQTDRELTREENNLLKKNMKLVNDLGAELLTSMDEDISRGIIRVARHHNISHIVVGKPLGYKSEGFFKKDKIIDTLIQESGEIDIFVVSEQNIRPKKKNKISEIFSKLISNNKIEYLYVTFWLIALISINLLLNFYISYFSIGFIFLVAVSVISSFYSRGPVLYFATSSAILWNFLFLKPRFTLYISHLEDLLMFLMYFIAAFIIGNLTTKIRVKELFLRKKEKSLEELYLMSNILNESNSHEEIIEKSLPLLRNIFSVKISVFLRDVSDNLLLQPFTGSDFILSEKEWDAVLWCFENNRPSGKGTDTFNMSKYNYMPLLSHKIPAGVLVIDTNGHNFSIEQENLLLALVSQISSALERIYYSKTQQKIKLAEESERIYQILLNTVSHELRTPITTISTAANALVDKIFEEKADLRSIFANDIIVASDRLNRIVDNLLGSLRIDKNNLTLNLEWYDISELISHVHNKLNKLLYNHKFTLRIDDNIPMLKFDFMLMDQLLTNLIYNAVLYTPADSKIELSVKNENSFIIFSVKDNGPGISDEDKKRIFNKFYKVRDSKSGGLGLGLYICKEIAEIHNGNIEIEDNKNGGANFIVKLQLQQSIINGELNE